MITDDNTNLVWVSGLLPDRERFYKELSATLTGNGVSFRTLPFTRDIWAVDYMPVQIAPERFICFRYEPDYLQEKRFRQTTTDQRKVCEALGLDPIYSPIKVDGGNVIQGHDWVILTDKVFRENPEVWPSALMGSLEELFGGRVIIIPQDPEDFTGHADGMVRYYANSTVLINQYRGRDCTGIGPQLKKVLKSANLDWVEVPYNPYKNRTEMDATGVYINFLRMKNLVLVPIFGIDDDNEALQLFEKLFPDSVVVGLHSGEIAREGGVINCVTWNVMARDCNVVGGS